MSEVDLKIGGRTFKVVCADGEEDSLLSAAALMDKEAQFILDQVGQVSENRMLLMAGLILGDRMSSQVKTETDLHNQIKSHKAEISELQSLVASRADQVAAAETLGANEKRDLEALRATAEADAEMIAKLHARIEAQGAEISGLKTALETAEKKTVETENRTQAVLADIGKRIEELVGHAETKATAISESTASPAPEAEVER